PRQGRYQPRQCLHAARHSWATVQATVRACVHGAGVRSGHGECYMKPGERPMIRALLRFVLVLVVVVAAAAFFFGYRWGGHITRPSAVVETDTSHAVGTAGVDTRDAATRDTARRERPRAVGADIGDKDGGGLPR